MKSANDPGHGKRSFTGGEAEVITGYRKQKPGWLIAVEEDGRVRPSGVMELGIGPKDRKVFYEVAGLIQTHEDRQFVHIEPRIRCRIKYKKRTHAGYLVSPFFKGPSGINIRMALLIVSRGYYWCFSKSSAICQIRLWMCLRSSKKPVNFSSSCTHGVSHRWLLHRELANRWSA